MLGINVGWCERKALKLLKKLRRMPALLTATSSQILRLLSARMKSLENLVIFSIRNIELISLIAFL